MFVFFNKCFTVNTTSREVFVQKQSSTYRRRNFSYQTAVAATTGGLVGKSIAAKTDRHRLQELLLVGDHVRVAQGQEVVAQRGQRLP